MPWNEKDFTRWRAQSYARLGVDHVFDATRINGVTNFLIVPANHIYLIRAASCHINNTAAVAANGYVQITRLVGEIYTIAESYFPAVIGSIVCDICFPYPIDMQPAGFIQAYSSAVGLLTRFAIHYTDVDLTTFPAYDPGY